MKLMFLDSNHDISHALQADYIWVLVLISYFSACMAAYTAWGMSEQFRLNRARRKGYVWLLGGAFSMGMGIWAMHYMGMAAVHFLPNTGPAKIIVGLDPPSLSILVIIITGLIMGLSILTSLFQQRLLSAYQTVEASQERLRNAINSISDGIVLFDENDKLVMTNNVFNNMYQSPNQTMETGISYQ